MFTFVCVQKSRHASLHGGFDTKARVIKRVLYGVQVL
jgi:hypothetical protein